MALKINHPPVEYFLKGEADTSVQIYFLFSEYQPPTLVKFTGLCGSLRLKNQGSLESEFLRLNFGFISTKIFFVAHLSHPRWVVLMERLYTSLALNTLTPKP